MKTFIHHDGALGDVLLSLPAIRTVSAEDSLVHFSGRDDVATLLHEAAIVDEVSSAGSGRYAAWYTGSIDEAGRRFLQRFDRAVVFTADPKAPFAECVRRELSTTRIIATVQPAGSSVHAARFRTDQLQDFRATMNGPLLPLPPFLTERSSGLLHRTGYDGSRPVVAVHPGSGGKKKNWPLDRFIALAEILRGRMDPFLVYITGPAENYGVRERIDAAVQGRLGVLHLGSAELISVAAVLRNADLFIGNDSGVSHLAAAVGCPVIALFGPTDPDIWGPQGPEVEIIRSMSLADIPVSQVADRAQERLLPVYTKREGRPAKEELPDR